MADIDDITLIRRTREGDESAWSVLMTRHKGAIYQAVKKAVRRGRDEDDAESWAHELFIRAVRGFDESNGYKFITYLWRSLEHVATRADCGGAIYLPPSAYRTNAEAAERARRVASLDAPRDEDGASLYSFVAEDQDDRLGMTGEDYERLSHALSLLDDRARDIMERRLKGETQEQIATVFGVTRSAISQAELKILPFLKSLLLSGLPSGLPSGRYRPQRLRARWSYLELQALKRLAPHSTIVRVAMTLGRSIGGTYRQAEALGIKSGHVKAWTPTDDDFLRTHRDAGWKWVARQLNRSVVAIRSRAARIGAERDALRRPDIDKVRELLSDGLTTTQIGEMLGVSGECIRRNLIDAGLKANPRNEQQRAETLRRNLLEKYEVATATEIRERQRREFARQFGLAAYLSPSAAVVTQALHRIAVPADKHRIAKELCAMAAEYRQNWFPKSWRSVLKLCKELCELGIAESRNGGRTLRLYHICTEVQEQAA